MAVIEPNVTLYTRVLMVFCHINIVRLYSRLRLSDMWFKAGISEQRLTRFTYSRAKHDHCLLNCVAGTGNDGQSAAVACSALAHSRPLTRSAECGGTASPPCKLLSRIHDDSSPQRSCPLAHDAAPEPRPLLQHWHPGQCSDRTAHTAS